ncbi:hypothetical protein ACW7EJ_17845, partial [Acinetobacter soli]
MPADDFVQSVMKSCFVRYIAFLLLCFYHQYTGEPLFRVHLTIVGKQEQRDEERFERDVQSEHLDGG